MTALRFICAQPAVPYYTWQIEVMLTNFISMGIKPHQIDILLGTYDHIPDSYKKLEAKFDPVRFFYYEDSRSDRTYIPNIYFHLMAKHFEAQPSIVDEVLFMHDSDIVFTRPPDFNAMIYDKNWYLSDTNSYINYDYVISKGESTYYKMCEIIGLDPVIPKLMNNHSGGAQYIVKNTSVDFWRKVESDSLTLYKYFCDVEHLYKLKHEGDYPIQKWTAGMWSVLWNAWRAGNSTVVDRRLDFGWVTNGISDVTNYCILHNAGVTDNKSGLFYKGDYIDQLPYNAKIEVDPNRASYYYWQQICKTAENSVLLGSSDKPNLSTINFPQRTRTIYTANLVGGLGNQLFQIAHLIAQCVKNNANLVLPINSHIAKTKDGNKIGNEVSYYKDNILSGFEFDSTIFDITPLAEKSYSFNPLLELDVGVNYCFTGHFHSSKNFFGFDTLIKMRFGPDNNFLNRMYSCYPELDTNETLSIHVRRGDHLDYTNVHPILSKSYIDFVVEHYFKNYSHIFVFSDDKEWCRSNLDYPNITFVSNEFDYEDLWMMSLCKNHILSPSTFGWWGSYLSLKEGRTCAPSVWYGPYGSLNWEDIYQPDWIVVQSKFEDGEIFASSDN